MNLQEATNYLKTLHNQHVDPNTLRKACASGRLKAVRKGEGNMHIRRTEWEVSEEDLLQFVRDKYHPRPSKRVVKQDKIHIPIIELDSNQNNNNLPKEPGAEKGFYRVIEHLYQKPLPIHGDSLENYDSRIVEEKIRSKARAEALLKLLESQAQANHLSDQLRYELESYTGSRKIK